MVGKNNDLMNIDMIVKELTQKIAEKFGGRIEQVILFGSYARGKAKEESDLDVLIIGDVGLDEVIEITYYLSLKHGIYISPIVMTKDYFEMLKNEGASFAKNVLDEGVVAYARA
jgi:predicted nucleotidyltransferase